MPSTGTNPKDKFFKFLFSWFFQLNSVFGKFFFKMGVLDTFLCKVHRLEVSGSFLVFLEWFKLFSLK